MDLGSQHMFNESQTNNVPVNDNSMLNESNSSNTANGGPSTSSTGTVLRTHNEDNKNGVDLNNRKRSKSKISPQNMSHMHPSNQFQIPNIHQRNLDEWLNSNSASANYQKNLDEWLNNTMKEMPNTYSASSSEFLDSNRSSAINGVHLANAAMANAFRLVPELQNTLPYGSNVESYFKVPGYMSSGLKLPQHNTDFTSLPPGVNLSHDIQRTASQNDLIDGLETRRFSDPCLANNSDDEGAQQKNDDKINLKNQSDNNKLLAYLIQQINNLHETNSKICRNLNDTKVDIEALKHAPSWNLRHRRDSISGFSTHSQPMGYAFGTHSPAPTYHSVSNAGMYTPGMMTDVVREVKEAARVREEALLSRVRSMVEERSWSMNENHLKMIRDLEELKSQVNQLKNERIETNKHIFKLEDELKSLRSLLSQSLNFGRTNATATPTNNSFAGVGDRGFIRHNADLRNYSNDRSKRHSLNLHYGIINQEDGVLSSPLFHNDIDHVQKQFNEILKTDELNYNMNGGPGKDGYTKNNVQNGHHSVSARDVNDGQLLQMEKDNLELRRELQDALATKKHADTKIQTLESLVKTLQTKIPPDQNNVITITTHSTSRNANANSTATDGKASSVQPQVATQIQSIVPRSNAITNGTSTINLSGPVTDL